MFLNVTCSSSEYGTMSDSFCFVTNGLLSSGGTLTRPLVNVRVGFYCYNLTIFSLIYFK